MNAFRGGIVGGLIEGIVMAMIAMIAMVYGLLARATSSFLDGGSPRSLSRFAWTSTCSPLDGRRRAEAVRDRYLQPELRSAAARWSMNATSIGGVGVKQLGPARVLRERWRAL